MKKYIVIGCILAGMMAFKNIGDAENNAAAINTAITKSIPLLQSTTHTFLQNYASCHSCHSEGLGGAMLSLAKEKGYSIDNTILNEGLDSIRLDWQTADNMLALSEGDDPVATTITGNYDLWALSANSVAGNKMTELLATNIMRRQTPGGNWMSPGQRPPMEYYSFSATALTIKNIQAYVPSILHKEVTQRIERARDWLIHTAPEANEEKIYQLLGLTWCDADKKIIARQAKKLLAAQHEDGGWPQLDSLKTDAYATGQSLYALNQSGQLAVTAPAYQNGIAFLLRTQMADGSWQVKTRSYPFVPYTYSGFPHGSDQFISAAGSNWATMALLLAVKKN